MEDIYSLIHSLTSREWESLQNYLTCFSTHANDEGGPKQLQLARILKQETDCPTVSRCCLKIYGIKEGVIFEKLKSRLKEKTLDFLLTDISSDKKQELDEADYAYIQMKKKSAQFQQLYYSKRRIPVTMHLLEDIIREAKKYEQYFILIEHLKAKKNLISWKQGKSEFENISVQIRHAVKCSELRNKVEHYYFVIQVESAYSGKQDEKRKLQWLRKAIAEVKTENMEVKSAQVNYSLKALEIEYCQLNKDYTTARSKCLEWLNIVRNNKSVFRRQRVGVVHDNLSRCDYYLGNYRQAAEWAMEAQKHFNLNSENFCISLEQEFYAIFAMKEYEQSVDLAERMLSSATRKELGEFRFSKYNFLHANALFMQGKYSDALAILSEEREISKDKAGWEIGARLLKIMTLIEMLKLDEARLAVLSLREFLKYTDKKTPVSLRDKTILNLLLILERAGFMFSTLNGSTEKHLKALRSQDETLRWEPFTHELIPFHEWFAGKMRIRPTLSGGTVKMPGPGLQPFQKALPVLAGHPAWEKKKVAAK